MTSLTNLTTNHLLAWHEKRLHVRIVTTLGESHLGKITAFDGATICLENQLAKPFNVELINRAHIVRMQQIPERGTKA